MVTRRRVDAAPAGKTAPAAAGTTTRRLQHAGIDRSYKLYVPAAPDPKTPRPLLLALHGGFGDGAAMERLTQSGFNRLADQEGFLVVYPDGVEKHWNDGRSQVSYRSHKEKIDDVGFLAALIDEIARQFPLDRQRVYATGMSNGAMMCHRLAAELSDRIAAIAPVGGSIPEDLLPRCRPPRPVPVLIISGTADPLVPWAGGDIRGGLFGQRSIGRVLSAPAAAEHWARHNGCVAPPAITRLADKDPEDGTQVRQEAYGGGKDGSEVILLAVEGGGHTWPSGWQYLAEAFVGKTCKDVDACAVIWEFFKRHGARAR